MTDSWKDEIFKRLDALASKLGVAAQYLFGLFVRQSVVTGIEFLLATVFCAGIALYFLSKLDKIRDWDKEGRRDRCGFAFASIAIGLLSILALCFAVNAVDYLANPQYWAFKKLLDTLYNQ